MELRVAFLAAEAATIGFVALMLTSHLLLRLLLSWHGFMRESRNPSACFKLWAVCVKCAASVRASRRGERGLTWALRLLTAGAVPSLYSFQASLPTLPVPQLEESIARWLTSVRPVVSDAEYARLDVLSAEFLRGPGPRLQRYLKLKSWWASNYVTDWWTKYVVSRLRRSASVRVQ